MTKQENYKYFLIALSPIFLDVHESMERLGTMNAAFRTGIISFIYKFRL